MGVLWKRGPCTAYTVIREFAESRSAFYRSGAGSIYPLLSRLRRAGFVQAAPGRGRRETLYTLTETGVEKLREWFRIGSGDPDFTCAADPLRSRAYFLAVLAPAERLRFVTDALHGLGTLLSQCENDVAAYRAAGDEFSAMAMAGSVVETRARIRWLQEIRRACEAQSRTYIEDCASDSPE